MLEEIYNVKRREEWENRKEGGKKLKVVMIEIQKANNTRNKQQIQEINNTVKITGVKKGKKQIQRIAQEQMFLILENQREKI